jgi:hypothetical protein
MKHLAKKVEEEHRAIAQKLGYRNYLIQSFRDWSHSLYFLQKILERIQLALHWLIQADFD